MTRKPSQSINIKSVAAEAGVSPMTISRVVNGHPDVAESTRSRVMDVIQRSGYHPNTLARSLIQGKSSTLGIVTGQLDRVEANRLLAGALSQAGKLGYGTFVTALPSENDCDGLSILQALIARQVDGVLWATSYVGRDAQWLDDLHNLALPPVVFTNLSPHKELRVVSLDVYKGARTAVQHLILRGKMHIAHLAGPQTGWEARQHQLAWQYALMAGGIDIDERACLACEPTLAGGAAGFKLLWQAYPEMDSLYADHDLQAVGAIHALHELGIKIPEQVAVVGFGDLPEAAAVWPALTSVRFDLDAMGAAAINELVAAICAPRGGEAGGKAQLPLFAPELIVRASSV
jgi:DNA-binding LacI/PurR family transcriptional regulator